MRRLAFVVGIALLLGSFPVATANHITVGTYDSIGTAPEEADNDGDRSVPGKTLGGEEAPNDSAKEFEIGTTQQPGCHDPSTNVSVDATHGPERNVEEAENTTENLVNGTVDSAEAHGFCGMLRYHELEPNNGQIEQVSLEDQDLRDPITLFDVTRAQTYFAGFGSCVPFCETIAGEDNPGEHNPQGVSLFNTTHDAGSVAGLTDDSETAYENEENRGWAATNVLHVTSPTNVVQETTDLWEMNGWWWPAALSTFVAFIEEGDGDPVSEDRLQEIVDNRVGTELPSTSEAAVCGYTPDFQFTTVGPGAAGLNCEFEFSYQPGNEGDGDRTLDGYEEPCNTPTYMCSSANGPAWYSQGCVCLGLTDPKIPGSDHLPGPDSTFAGPEGQTDYIRWHFVIAPHNSACGGAQEPGFSFTTDSASNPYLAHDVDVWTTAASTSYHDVGSAVPDVYDYADAVAEIGTEPVGEALADPTDDVPNLPLPAETDNAVRTTTLEPNNAQPVGELDDTSRSFENGALDDGPLHRSLDDPCEALFGDEVPGDDGTVDPWIDYLDSRALAVQDVDVTGTYATDERVIRQLDLYLNEDESQDGTNRPGPSLYATDGQVGMFSDKDDDGEFDQLEAGVKFNAQNTLFGGAVPMVWDMWANMTGEAPQPHVDEGCGVGGKTLSEAASELGYGVETGLAQAIYLNEPTAFYEPDNRELIPYEGNNIYLLLSNTPIELWDGTVDDGTDEYTISEEVDTLLEELQSYVTGDLGRETPTVINIAEEFELDSAFQSQCSGPTGNFGSEVQFTHDCKTLDCEGDTIATLYSFDLTEGTLEGSEILPTFEPMFDAGAYDFGAGQHSWYDVDPFDNNPERNEASDPPPNPDAGPLGEGLRGELLG